MPYRSKAEREAESKMTWTQVLEHVQGMEHCTESEARRQIANAIGDRALVARWEDERRPPFGPTQLPSPSDYPPEEKCYWQNVEIDPDNPDRVREPPPYDPKLVSKQEAARLDRSRKFRKPLFRRDDVLRLWPCPAAPVEHGVGANADSDKVVPWRPVSMHDLHQWYIARVKEFESRDRPPSREDDVQAAREHFTGSRVPRDWIRKFRNELAPKAWHREGPKPRA